MLTSPFAFLDFESCLPSPFEVTYICPTSHGTARRHAGDWRRDGVDSGGARILAGAGKRRIRGGFEDGAIGMELEDVSKDESAGVTLRDLLWFRVSLCPPKTRQKSCLPLFIGAVLNIPIP